MFINKDIFKKLNFYRISMKISQRVLADRLQLYGLDIDKNAIQRIESGQRFVTDIELAALSAVLHISLNALLELPE